MCGAMPAKCRGVIIIGGGGLVMLSCLVMVVTHGDLASVGGLVMTSRATDAGTQIRTPQHEDMPPIRVPSPGSPACDTALFLSRLARDPATIPRDLVAGCTKIIYNRIPKTASRTMRDVFNLDSLSNNYTSVYIDHPYVVDADEQKFYLREIANVENGRLVLVSHHYFTNFTRFYPYDMTYINVIREPISWFQSIYNFHRYTEWGNYGRLPPFNTPIGVCIHRSSCVNYIIDRWGSLRFLGGHDYSIYSKDAVPRVKSQLERTYLVVGLMEQLREFTEVLELIQPEMFLDLPSSFDRIANKSHEEFKTPGHDPISDSDLEILRGIMAPEAEIYAYVKQKFDKLYRTIKKSS